MEGTAAGSSSLIPYWYAVPSGAPSSVTVAEAPPAQMPVAQTTDIYFRVPDSSGIPVTDPAALRFTGIALAGGRTIGAITRCGTYPNLVYAAIRTGANPGGNSTLGVLFGNLPPLTFTVQAIAASQ